MSKRQKRKTVQLAQQKESTKQKRRIIEKVLSNSRNHNVTFNLNLLVDGWLELESDPGTFSLLIEDFGCFGAQVEEVYDLEQKFDGPVFGFIFLFKWLNNQQSDRSRLSNSLTSCSSSEINSKRAQNEDSNTEQKIQWSYVEDENIISEIFFAKQMISNSCATHALISILLNCDHDELNLGPILTRLKDHTKVLDPENKGYAIGNVPELAKAHNSHASYSSLYSRNKPSLQARGTSFMIRGNQRTNLQQQQNQPETYHFVSFVPINNRLYELDGLKNYPIDHGPIGSRDNWTEKFRTVIKQRLLENKTGDDPTLSNDIRYNLMAVVPDKRIHLKAQLKKFRCQYETVQRSIRCLSRPLPDSHSMSADVNESTTITNPPHSPQSNGTLTASESGSACNSPKINSFHDDNSIPTEAEIPRPPYSPLSNDTLTASEAGSIYNSSSTLDDNFFYNDESKIEKYVFIKFDKKAPQDLTDAPATNSNNATVTQTPASLTNPIASPSLQIPAQALGSSESSSSSSQLLLPPPPPLPLQPAQPGCDLKERTVLAIEDLKRIQARIAIEIERTEIALREENDKRRKYKIDNSRRTHNYEPFIMTFLSMLARQGNLADLIEKDLGLIQEEPDAQITKPSPISSLSSVPTPPQVITRPHQTRQKPRPQASQPDEKPPKPKYKYVSTGRPRGRPKKNATLQ